MPTIEQKAKTIARKAASEPEVRIEDHFPPDELDKANHRSRQDRRLLKDQQKSAGATRKR